MYTSNPRSFLAVGAFTLLLTTPAFALTYECEIRQRSWAGLISESYRFEIETEKGRVMVLDPIIRFANGKAIQGTLESVSETETRVVWGVEDVPIAPEGGPTYATFEALLTGGESVEVKVEAVWSDKSDAGNGKGRCALAQ